VWQAKPVASAVAFNDAACHAARLAHTQVVAATTLEQRMIDPALLTRGRRESSALTRKANKRMRENIVILFLIVNHPGAAFLSFL
jgi:hypothetical protein